MSEFMNDLFADTSKITGFNIIDTDNNHIINEAVILDELNGDTRLLGQFFDVIGKYGSRDGILSESANIDCCIGKFDNTNCAETAAILAVAKESGCKDYDLYVKAIMLMKECMENMKLSFSDIAKKRLEIQKAEVDSNIRVADAIDTVKQNPVPAPAVV